MKFFSALLCLFLLVSCSNSNNLLNNSSSFNNIDYSSITFKVSGSDSNLKAKVRTVFLESGFFKFDDIQNTTNLPFEKSYNREINFSANLALEYVDKTTENFKSYSITIQVFRDNILIDERDFLIDRQGKKVDFNTMTVK